MSIGLITSSVLAGGQSNPLWVDRFSSVHDQLNDLGFLTNVYKRTTAIAMREGRKGDNSYLALYISHRQGRWAGLYTLLRTLGGQNYFDASAYRWLTFLVKAEGTPDNSVVDCYIGVADSFWGEG